MMNKTFFARGLVIMLLFILASYLTNASTHAVKKTAPRVTLKLTRLDFSNGYWNYKTDWTLQNLNSGSIKVNGHIFVDGITQNGTDYTGYSLKPKKSYTFVYYSKNGGRGSVLARKTVVPPKGNAVTINRSPILTPMPTGTAKPNQKILEKFATMVYDGPIYTGQVTIDSYRVLRKFYETHPDIYDVMVIYSAIPTNTQQGSGLTVKNGILGNGSFYPNLDETAKYGSNGKLLLQVFMPPQLGVDNPDVEAQSYFLLHEVSHRWLMFIGDYADCKTNPNFNVKCKNPPTGFRVNNNGAHWDSNVDTAVRENGILYEDPNTYGESATAYNYSNGYCTRITPSQPRQFRFNDLDLYLMGFMSSSETNPIYWYDFTDASEAGQKCTQHTISAQDIINMEGPRQPAYPTAQRDFKIGFILLTAPGQNATSQQINRIKNIVDSFPKAWNEATRKLSTMNIPF